MSREVLLLVDALAREKSVAREVVFAALESALASAAKKQFKDEVDVLWPLMDELRQEVAMERKAKAS